MKRLLVIFAWLASGQVAGATTFHSIPQTGSDIGFVADETFATSSATRTAFATWDADRLYLAFRGEPVNPFHLPNRRLVWYFDTDPQPAPVSGDGTTTTLPFGLQTWTLPFRADYALLINPAGGWEFRRWDGGAWVSESSGALWGLWCACAPEPHLRLGLPRSVIGSPASIYVLGYILSFEAGAETTYASWPNDSLVGGDGFKPAGVFAHWFGFPLANGLSPNDPSFHDQTLPVELMGFSIE